MAGKKLEYQIAVDSTKGVSGVKQFSSAVKRELKSIEGDFDDTATAGQKVSTVLSKMAKELDTELDRAAQAADALAQALGPELAGKADVGVLVGDLQRMGLSFEEIVADADKLAAALKELDQVQTKGLDAGLGNVDTKLGNIGRSAGGSRSVLANMIGNTTQDLGVLTGVAGSAGVAIGQMGEYMADALGEGEKLGSVISNFAKIAGPIAAITIAMQSVSEVMASMKAADAFNDEQVKKFSEALRDGTTFAEELHDTIEETGELPFLANVDPGVLNNLTNPLRGFTKEVQNLVPVMGQLGITTDEFLRLVDDPTAFQEFLQRMEDQGTLTKDNFRAMQDLSHGVDQYRVTQEEAAAAGEVLNEVLEVTPQLASDATRAFLKAKDPIKSFPDEFLRIGKAISTGFRPTIADLEEVSEGLGIGLPEALALGEQAWNEHQSAMEDAAQAAQDALTANKEVAFAATQAWIDSKEAAQDAALEIADANTKMRDLADVFKRIGTRQDAMRRVFQFGNAPLEARNAVYDIEASIDDLRHFLRDEGVPDIFDPDDVDAGPFLDKIAALRDPIQTAITDAFAAGGPEAARTVAANYVESITEEMRGRLTPEQVEELLGIADLEAQIKVAIEETSLANARAQLALLTGLPGADPIHVANIQLALDAGSITPRQAQILVQDALRDAGVIIPAEIDVKEKPGALQAAQEALQASADKNPIEQDLEAVPVGLKEARDLAQAYMDMNPATLPVQPVLVGTAAVNAALAAAGFGAGTLAAPAAGPMAMTTAGVTPMAGPSLPTLMLPVAAPRAAVQPVVINQTIQAAVIGSPFDVMTAVDEANRRVARLLPKNP